MTGDWPMEISQWIISGIDERFCPGRSVQAMQLESCSSLLNPLVLSKVLPLQNDPYQGEAPLRLPHVLLSSDPRICSRETLKKTVGQSDWCLRKENHDKERMEKESSSRTSFLFLGKPQTAERSALPGSPVPFFSFFFSGGRTPSAEKCRSEDRTHQAHHADAPEATEAGLGPRRTEGP